MTAENRASSFYFIPIVISEKDFYLETFAVNVVHKDGKIPVSEQKIRGSLNRTKGLRQGSLKKCRHPVFDIDSADHTACRSNETFAAEIS